MVILPVVDVTVGVADIELVALVVYVEPAEFVVVMATTTGRGPPLPDIGAGPRRELIPLSRAAIWLEKSAGTQRKTIKGRCWREGHRRAGNSHLR